MTVLVSVVLSVVALAIIRAGIRQHREEQGGRQQSTSQAEAVL